jgi:hypothetical protein
VFTARYALNSYTGCPNRYRTQHFFNNSNTNEDIATKQAHTTDTYIFISHTTNVLLVKSRCNIFIGYRIIKEMPGLVGGGTLCIFQYISSKMQRYTVYFIWKMLYMFRVVPPPIIRSAYNCIYNIWYLSDRYCYLPL